MGLAPVNIPQDFRHPVIDGILRQLNMLLQPGAGVGPQAVDGRIRVYILGIYGYQ